MPVRVSLPPLSLSLSLSSSSSSPSPSRKLMLHGSHRKYEGLVWPPFPCLSSPSNSNSQLEACSVLVPLSPPPTILRRRFFLFPNSDADAGCSMFDVRCSMFGLFCCFALRLWPSVPRSSNLEARMFDVVAETTRTRMQSIQKEKEGASSRDPRPENKGTRHTIHTHNPPSLHGPTSKSTCP